MYIGHFYRIWLFQVRLEPDIGESSFSDHRTICLMKLMVLTMLSA